MIPPMPGRFFLTSPVDDIATYLGAETGGMDTPARRNVSPGQELCVCRPDKTLAMMRWGIIPVGRVNARGRPVMETIINARSESVFEKSAFDGVGRCLVPADGWYEWTGEKRRKTAWSIRRANGDPVAFAGICDIWTGPGDIRLPQVAILTCPPSADVRDIHHRMGVILEPALFDTWLSGTQAQAAEVLRTLPDGVLTVEKALDVDWTGR